MLVGSWSKDQTKVLSASGLRWKKIVCGEKLSGQPTVCPDRPRTDGGVEVPRNQLAAPPAEGSDASVEQHVLIDGEKGSPVSPADCSHSDV